MDVPLTSFIDFVLKSGSPKMTSARKIKDQQDEAYDPITDYYKRFREAVIDLHKGNLGKGELRKLIGSLPSSKADNYSIMIKGYQKFLGTKDATWISPPRKIWKHDDLSIAINPEIGLKWSGLKYIIKLYLKADPISKDRVSSILALMKENFAGNDVIYSLLDVRTSKLYQYDTSMSSLLPLIRGEAQALQLILKAI